MADQSPHPAGATQNTRRVTYGLNVLVAVLLALSLVVFLNWISNRQYKRFDLTAAGQYSLSPQTKQVLKDLKDDYQIVTLFRADNSNAVRARDLVAEYGRRSSHIRVQHIDTAAEPEQLDLFYTELKDRYADKLKPMETAVNRGTEALEEVKKQHTAQIAEVSKLLKNPAVGEGDAVTFAQRLTNELTRLANEVEQAKEDIKTYLGGGGRLPSFTKARDQVAAMLTERTKIYGVAIAGFERATAAQDTPSPVKEAFLTLVPQFKASQKTIADALTVIQGAAPVDEYDQLSTQFSSGQNTVAILAPKQVRVVPLVEMFRESAQRRAGNDDEAQPELDFLGEERITGTLIAMSLKNPPLVVFVFGSQPALGPGGQYQQIADRLQKLGLKVDQWTPSPRPGPMGQMIPPGPPPKGEEGQRLVWIVLPFDPPNRFNPMGGGGEQIVPVITERVATGDSAIFMLGYSPVASMGGADPLLQMIEPWGITPHLDRIVLQEVAVDARRKRPTAQHAISEWPANLPITVPLSGLAGVVSEYGLPMEIKSNKETGVEVSPLIVVRGSGLWAEKNLQQGGNEIKLDPAMAAESFIIGAASQSKTGRIIVIGDPGWATDRVVNLGQLGEGTAPLTGAVFPANAELFVNGVLWLSNLDTLIAASAHTQDIRRVDSLSPGSYKALRWALLAGIPIAILLAGTGVWLVRRRG